MIDESPIFQLNMGDLIVSYNNRIIELSWLILDTHEFRFHRTSGAFLRQGPDICMALDMQIMSIVNAGWIGANDYVYRNEKEIFQSEFGEFLLAWRKRRERQ